MASAKRLLIALSLGLSVPASLSCSAADDAPGAQAPASEATRGDATSGSALYRRYCRGCHGDEGKGDGLVFMPHVDNLTRKGYIDQLPDSYLQLAIRKGGPGIGKSTYMPAWDETLSDRQILDLIAYIRSLPLH